MQAQRRPKNQTAKVAESTADPNVKRLGGQLPGRSLLACLIGLALVAGPWNAAFAQVTENSPVASEPAAQELADLEPDPAALARIAEEIDESDQPALSAFLAGLTKDRTLALLEVTEKLPGMGERGLFTSFLMGLPADQREKMLALIEAMSTAEHSAYARELDLNPPDKWIAVPRLLATSEVHEVRALMFQHVPCHQIIPTDKFQCRIPPGTDEFFADWTTVWAPAVRTKVKAHGVLSPRYYGVWQAQILKAGNDARPYSAAEKTREFGTFGRNLQDFERHHVCGGAYIKPGWILTAAHCTGPPQGSTRPDAFLSNRKVRLGTTDIGQGGGTIWRIDGVVRHSRADPDHADKGDDIALLHIVEPTRVPGRADPEKLVQPATIRLATSRSAKLTDGDGVIVTGWGVTGIAERTHQVSDQSGRAQVSAQLLQAARLKYLDGGKCNHDRRFLRKGYKLGPGQICAGSIRNETACLGDSGGPLISVQQGATPVLVGLVSYGIGCGGTNAPSVFVDVKAYEDWIEEAMKQYKRGQIVNWPPR